VQGEHSKRVEMHWTHGKRWFEGGGGRVTGIAFYGQSRTEKAPSYTL